jgi:uncharacterized membrane protein
MAEATPTKKEEDKKPTDDPEQVKIMAALAYFGILFFLPLVTNPESTFGKFHANQGLLLLLFGIIGSTIGTVIPIIGWFLILPLVSIASLVFFIMGIVTALNKEMKRLPLIGNYDLIK